MTILYTSTAAGMQGMLNIGKCSVSLERIVNQYDP